MEGSSKDEILVRGELGQSLGVVLVVDQASCFVDDVDGEDHLYCPVGFLVDDGVVSLSLWVVDVCPWLSWID